MAAILLAVLVLAHAAAIDVLIQKPGRESAPTRDALEERLQTGTRLDAIGRPTCRRGMTDPQHQPVRIGQNCL
ncbi:hypothetical protein BH11PSE3_BH11PSE3_32650 [soil metagenome]